MCAMNTDRISVVKPTVEHLGPLIDLFSDPKVRQFLGGPLSRAKAAGKAKHITSNPNAFHWSVVDRSNTFLGFIEVSEHHDSVDLEISYQFLPNFWAKGYAFESLEKVLKHLFEKEGIEKILAETQAKNSRSIKLLKKLGFREFKQLRRFEESQLLFIKHLGE